MIVPAGASVPARTGRSRARALPLALLLLVTPAAWAQAQSQIKPPLPGATPATLTTPPPPPPDPRQPPAALPGALTLPQALSRALAQNPTLLAARQNLAATHAGELQAGVRANPVLGVNGTNVSLPAQGASNPYAYAVQVSRLFERGEKRRWRLDGAVATTAQTAAQLRDQERGVTLAVQQAFTAMLIAKSALALSQANLAGYQRQLQINYDRLQAGDLGKLDYERLELQLAQFESDQSAARVHLGQSSDQLQTLLGAASPDSHFDITGPIVPPDVALQLPTLEAQALAARPDYQAALAAVRVADANLRLDYANGTADPTLEGEYDRSGTFNSAGFNLTVPIRIFDRNQGNKAAGAFLAQGSRFAVVAAKNQVLSDVDQAFTGYTESLALSRRYTSHYLDEAADVLSISQFAYAHGGLALVDYLDALRASRQTTADALQAYSDAWLALYQLSYSAATPLAP